MVLQERDYLVLRQIHRWRFLLGRHIKSLCGFGGTRATDRRLKLLTESGYIERKKYLYGIPYLYTLTYKGRILLGVNKNNGKIRIEKVSHDVHVLDTAIYFMKKFGLTLDDITTEKELHIIDGFGLRNHRPDFVFKYENKKYAVEVELSLKPKERFEMNVKENYLSYDIQYWILSSDKTKIFKLLEGFQKYYGNINIVLLGEVLMCVEP